MISTDEITIESALEHERWTMQRQTLLKRLWKLQQARAKLERTVLAAGQSTDAVLSRHRSFKIPSQRDHESSALRV